MTFYISVHHSLHIVCFTAHNSFSVRTVYSTCKDAKRGIASSRLRKFVRPLNRSAIAIIVRVWYVELIWDYKIYISGWSITYCLSKLRWKDECAKIDFTKCFVIFKSSKASIDQGKNYLTKYLNQDHFCYNKYALNQIHPNSQQRAEERKQIWNGFLIVSRIRLNSL